MAYDACKNPVTRKASLKEYYVKTHLKLLIFNRMMGVSVGLHQWSKNFLTNYLKTKLLTQEQELLLRINNRPINYIDPSIKNFRDTKYTYLIYLTFGVLILRTCS